RVRGSTGELRYRPSRPDRAGFGTAGIRGALAAWVAAALVERGGLLLHSARMRAGGREGVALGPSGAGKSTFSAMFAPTDIFNDELVAVRWDEGPALHSTPFSGTLADPRLALRAPLAGLLTLEKGSQTAVAVESAVTTAAM